MGFDEISGNFKITDFAIRALPQEPFRPFDGLEILPAFDCKSTVLQFNDVPKSVIDRGHYHTFNVYPFTLDLSALALSTHGSSPWIYGAWARAQLATDFRDVGCDDFTFDLATGAGYRFSETFTFGIGGAVTNLNNHVAFVPGIGLDWIISDQLRIGICGPVLDASYSPDANWQFSLRGDASGEIWTILDRGGDPLSFDLSSYRLGLFASRRLIGEIWLNAGAGATIGNRIRLAEPNGDTILKLGMTNGLFGQLSVTIKTW